MARAPKLFRYTDSVDDYNSLSVVYFSRLQIFFSAFEPRFDIKLTKRSIYSVHHNSIECLPLISSTVHGGEIEPRLEA